MIALSLLLALVGFACFAFATDEHHHRLTGRRLSAPVKHQWRNAGWMAVTLAFAPAIVARGWIVGPIAWTGLLMLAAGIIFLLLNLGPRRRTAKSAPAVTTSDRA